MSARFGPDELLDCYRRGVFPMAESREADHLFLVDPDWRGVLPLDRFHLPRRLGRTVRGELYRVTADTDFAGCIAGCAEPKEGREDTWINPSIASLYSELFRRGFAHSIECWDKDGRLVGGLYGVALGAAFFGESMFSRARDASKVALAHLVARLKLGQFKLLDAQFWTAHLAQFGVEQIPRAQFRRRLKEALDSTADFAAAPSPLAGDQVLQLITQTS